MEYYSAIKKDYTTNTCNSMGESQKPYAERKEPDTIDYIPYESMCMTFWKGETMGTEILSVVARGWGRGQTSKNIE